MTGKSKHLALILKVAYKLAGKPVRVRFKEHEGLVGCCRADNFGIVTIDIQPGLTQEQFLRVFLHELVHAKFDKFYNISLEKTDTARAKDNWYTSLKELRAEVLAEVWLKRAEQNRDKTKPYFEGCLNSLLEH